MKKFAIKFAVLFFVLAGTLVLISTAAHAVIIEGGGGGTCTTNADCGACGSGVCSGYYICSSGSCTGTCSTYHNTCASTTACQLPSGYVCGSETQTSYTCNIIGSCSGATTSCGTISCPSGQTCSSGSCVVSCPSGQTLCGGTCQTIPTCSSPYISSSYCYYGGTPYCTGSYESCTYLQQYCPTPGTVSGSTCYYGTQSCTSSGCGDSTCTLGSGQTCSATSGCTTPQTLSVSASPASAPADGTSAIVITVYASTTTSVTVVLSTTIGSLASSSCTTVYSPYYGNYCSLDLTSTTAGSGTVTATASGYTSGSTSVSFTSTTQSTHFSGVTFSATCQTGLYGSPPYTEVIEAKGYLYTSSGAGVPNAPITATILWGAVTLEGPPSATISFSDKNIGQPLNLETGGTCPTVYTNSAGYFDSLCHEDNPPECTNGVDCGTVSYPGGSGYSAATYSSGSYCGGSSGSGSLTVSASPTTVTANGVSSSTITVKTSNSASGVSVSLSTNLGSLSASSCSTGSGGSCNIVITSSSTGTATVTASASGYSSGSTTVNFVKCLVDSDCTGGYVCNTATNQCDTGVCSTNGGSGTGCKVGYCCGATSANGPGGSFSGQCVNSGTISGSYLCDPPGWVSGGPNYCSVN